MRARAGSLLAMERAHGRVWALWPAARAARRDAFEFRGRFRAVLCPQSAGATLYRTCARRRVRTLIFFDESSSSIVKMPHSRREIRRASVYGLWSRRLEVEGGQTGPTQSDGPPGDLRTCAPLRTARYRPGSKALALVAAPQPHKWELTINGPAF